MCLVKGGGGQEEVTDGRGEAAGQAEDTHAHTLRDTSRDSKRDRRDRGRRKRDMQFVLSIRGGPALFASYHDNLWVP